MLAGDLCGEKIAEMTSKEPLKFFQISIIVECTDELALGVFSPGFKEILERFPLPEEFFEFFRRVERRVWLTPVAIHM